MKTTGKYSVTLALFIQLSRDLSDVSNKVTKHILKDTQCQ